MKNITKNPEGIYQGKNKNRSLTFRGNHGVEIWDANYPGCPIAYLPRDNETLIQSYLDSDRWDNEYKLSPRNKRKATELMSSGHAEFIHRSNARAVEEFLSWEWPVFKFTLTEQANEYGRIIYTLTLESPL